MKAPTDILTVFALLSRGIYSREHLIKVCTRLGYPLSSRKLTDWVRKGLLPPLKQHGRGQGMGKEYFWPSRAVIAQAVVVSEYLSWTNRSDDTLLLTWFAGYSVPLDQVRRIWARRHADRNSAVNQKFPDSFELHEWIRRAYTGKVKNWVNHSR